jgi:hypothetical protein
MAMLRRLHVALKQPASQPRCLPAAGDACIFMILASNWFSSMYRNHHAGLPTSALLQSFVLRHGLSGRLHKYVKQKVINRNAFQPLHTVRLLDDDTSLQPARLQTHAAYHTSTNCGVLSSSESQRTT